MKGGYTFCLPGSRPGIEGAGNGPGASLEDPDSLVSDCKLVSRTIGVDVEN